VTYLMALGLGVESSCLVMLDENDMLDCRRGYSLVEFLGTYDSVILGRFFVICKNTLRHQVSVQLRILIS